MRLTNVSAMMPEKYEGYDTKDNWVVVYYRFGVLQVFVFTKKTGGRIKHELKWNIGEYGWEGVLPEEVRESLLTQLEACMSKHIGYSTIDLKEYEITPKEPSIDDMLNPNI